MKSDRSGPLLLQLFNQYLESGGEELWVDRMLELSGEGFEIKDLRFHSHDWVVRSAPGHLKQVGMLWRNPSSLKRLRDMAREVSPDVLLFHNLIPVASLAMYSEAKRIGLPVIQYVHNFRPFSPSGTLWTGDRVEPAALWGNPWPEVVSRSWEQGFLKTLILAALQSFLLRSGALDVVTRWIAVSEFVRDKFVEGGIPEDRVVTLRHCWALSDLDPDVREGKHYLFLGRLVNEKGLETLVEAWTILEDRLGDRCPLLIIAGTGREEARMQILTDRLGKVACIGFIEGARKRDLINSCRGVLAPSLWWEPLGLIVHEAYDACRPVLAARSGGLTETVADGETGFVHQPGNAAELAEHVMMLEEAGPLGRRKMGERGRRWLKEHASPERWQTSFRRIVAEAIEEGRSLAK